MKTNVFLVLVDFFSFGLVPCSICTTIASCPVQTWCWSTKAPYFGVLYLGFLFQGWRAAST